ncbi:MAG TPA: RyR domain-containing protein [Pyrinomonadaceae bacterium]|jgi:hypothetical protein
MNIEQIARICHESNRALCDSIGDHSQTSWDEAPEWQHASSVNTVRFHLDNPEADASASHENWMREKLEDGWRYGETKDANAKTHPWLVPFEQLPPEQQAKDYLLRGIILALAPFVKQ